MLKGAQKRGAQNYKNGLCAEMLCALSLCLRGYVILARRYRSKFGEIDFIVKRGGTLAVVEVKHRATLPEAAEAIRVAQRERLERAIKSFLAQKPCLQTDVVRFDAMLTAPWRWPRHVENAWEEKS